MEHKLLDFLNTVHPSYSDIGQRWNFLYASYVGGKVYRDGAYLRKYWGEHNAPYDVYNQRLQSTPLDNHVKTTVEVYRSFIFRNPPKRTFGAMAGNPFIEEFNKNVDFNGQSMNSFMKTALDWAIVLGHVWINVDRPAQVVDSAQQEIELGIRAYTNMYTPQSILDWRYDTVKSGKAALNFIKVLELKAGDMHIVKIWYIDRVEKYTLKYDIRTKKYTDIMGEVEVSPNLLGYIPFVVLMPQRSPIGDIGTSIVGDVADMQHSIYNKLSELEQTIRLSGHPTLVKTENTEAAGGAGAIINIPNELDPGLMPTLLQPSGSSINSIIAAIDHDVEAINTMTHLSAVRAKQGSPMSGVALQTERQLLNTMLSDLADTVEETEIKVWNIWFDWMDMVRPEEFLIEYQKSFDIRDEGRDLDLLSKSLDTVSDPAFQKVINKEIAKLMIKDEEELNIVLKSIEEGSENTGHNSSHEDDDEEEEESFHNT